MVKLFQKKKKSKPIFWLIFGAIFFFFNLKIPSLLRTISYRFLKPCQNSGKTTDPIPTKRPEDGRSGLILLDSSGYRWGSNNYFKQKKNSLPLTSS